MEYILWRDEKIKELSQKDRYTIEDLRDVVTILRGEGGCPWDREQDHHSLRQEMIEECYEVVEALDADDSILLREELGDVFLQVIFHASIEKDAGRFDLDDVAHDECVKMIHRHPHIFGSAVADTADAVLENWEKIKTEEKQRNTIADKLNAIPVVFPALLRAQKVGKTVDRGTYAKADDVIMSLHERLEKIGNKEMTKEQQTDTVGEILYQMCRLCQSLGINAEEALRITTNGEIRNVMNQIK